MPRPDGLFSYTGIDFQRVNMNHDSRKFQRVAAELRPGMEVSLSSGAQPTQLSAHEQLFRFDVEGEEALHLVVKDAEQIEAIFYPGSEVEFRRTMRTDDFN
jgi:glyoxylate utilization-related uncharacterized protein